MPRLLCACRFKWLVGITKLRERREARKSEKNYLFSIGVYLIRIETRKELFDGLPSIRRVVNNDIQGSKLVVEEAAMITGVRYMKR